MSARQTLRCLASATGIPKTTLMRHLAAGVFRRATTCVMPKLTDVHKARRLAFALPHVEYYLTKDELAPYQACPNRRYIGKNMFLAAVVRPRYDAKRKTYFDGKIGIWPIIEYVLAQRSSANRTKGTIEVKNANTTRKKVYVKMLKEKVFPAIRQLWPGRKSLCIKVQQDNAGPHVAEDNADILEAGIEHGWTIEMTCQPPRSPDMNVLDLGLFNAIQSVQYRYPTHNHQGLIAVVEDAFRSLPRTTIDKCFVTLQRVLKCVISCGGGNNYALPRVRKLYLNARSNVTPSSLPIPKEIVIKGFRLLEAK
ncbi:hypothetical protein L916_14999 [Phytophthora nicotianae]|uniref:Tc1-like transposase DDE domain-containing protein n=1 Tax=Phytophthora nicotianae TaxID=4792 RepID=W2IE20_PHYNI|nr:hypothetical protein L916_14999 [Phytophthora nicotianae]